MISDVLLNYPGVAVPEGEAHRHEPPIPHDEVKVDTRKNNAELEEDKKQPVPQEPEQEANRDEEQGHAVEVENKQDNKLEEKPKPAEVIVRKEEVDLGGGEVLSNEVLDKPNADAGKKQDVSPLKKLDPVKDPFAGNVAAVENQAAAAQVNNGAKDAAGKREYLSLFLYNCSLRQLGGKTALGKCNIDFVIFADPLVPLPEGEHHPAADEAPAADSKDTADEKLDGTWGRKL